MARLYGRGRPIDPAAGTLLFWVPGGMPLLLHVESSIAAAMKLRGYNVHAIICNAPYRACAARLVQDNLPLDKWKDVCPGCITKTSSVLETMGIPYSYNGDFITEDERLALWKRTADVTWDTLDDLKWEGMSVGKYVRSAVIRFLQGASLEGHEAVTREYAYGALVTACAAGRAIEKFKPWRVFMSHGVYTDWGPALHTALDRGVPVTAWKSSYLSSHFYLRHVADAKRMDFNKLTPEVWNEVESRELTSRQEARLDKFFEDRYERRISFDMKQPKDYRDNVSELRARYAPDNKPVWAVLAHVNWDSVADYSPMAYPHFDDWILDTVRTAITTPEVQWLIKIHPAEASSNPENGVERLIERNFPDLPDHVRVIPAQEDISPANLFELIDGGVTVYGTSGLELALRGKPVILGGEAHYGGKGFTRDGLTPDSYRQLLRCTPTLGPLTDDQRSLVRRYAYAHFIRRQVPLEMVRDPNSKWWSLQHQRRELLLPGNDPFLDFICDRLIDGRDFTMGESLVAISGREVP
ncbi:MAG: hypothetical protein ABIW94_05965 [Gemmatimonadaceae bacterium]